MNALTGMDHLKKIAFRIAVCGGLATVVAINSVPFILNRRIRETQHYKKALELLSNHADAVKYLGKPITARRILVSDPDHYGADDEKMWFKVPVTGPNGKGFLFYNVKVKDYDKNSPELSRVELTVDKFKDYKLIIKSE
ncbi:uncharacterized protein LOC106638239 [Copidosoma floridanum]|uniref:uncharacterized protein LOC106638239 n=1 Tax=Copidosoma floridanum TaxID=29053 RepID=UPI0006C97842|nr:uncharacterized protein LOC106638239 [Copidosoma floridanum]